MSSPTSTAMQPAQHKSSSTSIVDDRRVLLSDQLFSEDSPYHSLHNSPCDLQNPVTKLTEYLQNWQLADAPNKGDGKNRVLAKKLQGLQNRCPIWAETLLEPDSPTEHARQDPSPSPASTHDQTTLEDHIEEKDYLLGKAATNIPSEDQVYRNHLARQYQWVLSLPTWNNPKSDLKGGDECEKQYFYCNLLSCKTESGSPKAGLGHSTTKYVLLATRFDEKPSYKTTANLPLSGNEFEVLKTRNLITRALAMDNPSPAWSTLFEDSPTSIDSTYGSETDRQPSETRSQNSRIEDSLEALDKFEEEVEAVSMAAQVDALNRRNRESLDSRVSGSASRARVPADRAPWTAKNATDSPASVRAKKNEPARRSSEHASSSVPESDQENQKPAARTPSKRPVARPASLAPPKPLQKAAKPPTRSTFELPGEKVARELKERKAARLSMQVSPEKLAEAMSPQRSKSVRTSKPLTRPTFELPGEAISRRKREEHAAKLKAQEEEERKRREFKAKPIRSSMGAFVRETATSRARTSKTGQPDKASPRVVSTQPTTVAKKRQSMMTSSLARTVSNISSNEPTMRGRPSAVADPSALATHRGASSSDGSISAKRSNVSAEDARQKLRGKDVYSRDNSVSQDQTRAKLQRQESIKSARQKYGEQSRMLSREKAEKQRQARSRGNSSTADAEPASPERYGLATNY